MDWQSCALAIRKCTILCKSNRKRSEIESKICQSKCEWKQKQLAKHTLTLTITQTHNSLMLNEHLHTKGDCECEKIFQQKCIGPDKEKKQPSNQPASWKNIANIQIYWTGGTQHNTTQGNANKQTINCHFLIAKHLIKTITTLLPYRHQVFSMEPQFTSHFKRRILQRICTVYNSVHIALLARSLLPRYKFKKQRSRIMEEMSKINDKIRTNLLLSAFWTAKTL